MRIPGFMLRQSVSVRPYLGTGAYGDQWGDSFTVRCRIEPRNELIRDSAGNETVASAKMYTAPGVAITPQSEVTWNGVVYDVMSVMPEPGPGGNIHHQEVLLR